MRSRLLLLSSIIAAALAAAPGIASAQRVVSGGRILDRYSDTGYDVAERVERAQRRAIERAARARERARDRSARAYDTRIRVDRIDRINRDRDYQRNDRMMRMRDRIEDARARARWRVRW